MLSMGGSYADKGGKQNPQGSSPHYSSGLQNIKQYLANPGDKNGLVISIQNSATKKRPNTQQNGKRSKKRRQI
jgi:hypothetical protein